MADDTEKGPRVSALLKIHYDKAFIPVALNFLEAMAGATGIAAASTRRLCLLVEESLSFVIDKYIDSRLEAHIELAFSLHEGGRVVLEIVDMGPPIHADRIPEFDLEDAASAPGLWYKLVREVADDFSFANNGKQGWRIRMEKAVTLAQGEKAWRARGGAAAEEPSLREHNVRLAAPADAGELIDLAFLTYRYSYGEDFYHRERLERAIERGAYEITVLENGSRIVGAYIVSHPDSGEPWAEMGGAMVLPEYRTTRAVLYLFRAMGEYMAQNPRNCDYFTSHLVTTHPRSQKLLLKIKPPFIPLFLFPNMVPHLEFIGISKDSAEREAVLWSYSMHEPFRQGTLHAPGQRHALLRKLLDNTGFGGSVALAEAFQEPPHGETRIALKPAPHQGFAQIRLESLGPDWFAATTRAVLTLLAEGMESINVNIPTATPLPQNLEPLLASIGLLFSGIHMAALDALDLAYCLTTRPIDFDAIQLQDPVARELLASMRKEYAALRRK
ncbi:MAG: hypothetical protein AB7D51_13665 [Desulfovibrionaceae bacterium]